MHALLRPCRKGRHVSERRAMRSILFVAIVVASCIFACTSPPIPLPFLHPDAGSSANAVQPKLTDIQAKIFTPSCSQASCHGGDFPQAGLSLKAGASRASLLNVAAQARAACGADAGSAGIRVVPSHADQSFLMTKLDV